MKNIFKEFKSDLAGRILNISIFNFSIHVFRPIPQFWLLSLSSNKHFPLSLHKLQIIYQSFFQQIHIISIHLFMLFIWYHLFIVIYLNREVCNFGSMPCFLFFGFNFQTFIFSFKFMPWVPLFGCVDSFFCTEFLLLKLDAIPFF